VGNSSHGSANTLVFRGQWASSLDHSHPHLSRGRNRGSRVVELSALCTKISRISMALKGREEKWRDKGGRGKLVSTEGEGKRS
jgi:hypothetical protein